MAEYLFISPSELTTTTILGGNVDVDKYLFSIANVQITVIEPLLGSELYDKILSEAESETLTGDYETLYNEYIKPITKYQALAEYIEISSFMITNAGAFKNQPDNAVIMEKDELMQVSQKYSGLADMYIIRFEKWICKNPLTEYKTSQDEVDATKDIRNIQGWHLGNSGEPTLYE